MIARSAGQVSLLLLSSSTSILADAPTELWAIPVLSGPGTGFKIARYDKKHAIIDWRLPEMESAHQSPPAQRERERERDRQFVPLPEHWLVLGILAIFVGSGILGWLGVMH